MTWSTEELAAACRNNTVGPTTVGLIRELGYDVVVTSGHRWHATVVVPNRGLVLLRQGQISQARLAFERAQTIYPEGPLLNEVGSLQTYDHHAREVARRVRTIAERFPNRPVAA